MSPDSKTSTSDFIKEHVEGCLKAIDIGDIQAVSMVQIKEEYTSVDLVLTNGKRMVKALPMALPGASQGCRTLGYDRGGDKAPQTRSNGCREIVFGHDAPLWSEPFNRSRTVMAAVRVAHPPAPRWLARELFYHPQHP